MSKFKGKEARALIEVYETPPLDHWQWKVTLDVDQVGKRIVLAGVDDHVAGALLHARRALMELVGDGHTAEEGVDHTLAMLEKAAERAAARKAKACADAMYPAGHDPGFRVTRRAVDPPVPRLPRTCAGCGVPNVRIHGRGADGEMLCRECFTAFQDAQARKDGSYNYHEGHDPKIYERPKACACGEWRDGCGCKEDHDDGPEDVLRPLTHAERMGDVPDNHPKFCRCGCSDEKEEAQHQRNLDRIAAGTVYGRQEPDELDIGGEMASERVRDVVRRLWAENKDLASKLCGLAVFIADNFPEPLKPGEPTAASAIRILRGLKIDNERLTNHRNDLDRVLRQVGDKLTAGLVDAGFEVHAGDLMADRALDVVRNLQAVNREIATERDRALVEGKHWQAEALRWQAMLGKIGWQPIESAPRDGSTVVALGDPQYPDDLVLVYWTPGSSRRKEGWVDSEDEYKHPDRWFPVAERGDLREADPIGSGDDLAVVEALDAAGIDRVNPLSVRVQMLASERDRANMECARAEAELAKFVPNKDAPNNPGGDPVDYDNAELEGCPDPGWDRPDPNG